LHPAFQETGLFTRPHVLHNILHRTKSSTNQTYVFCEKDCSASACFSKRCANWHRRSRNCPDANFGTLYLPIPIPPGDSFSDEDHGAQTDNCTECCVEQLGPHSLGHMRCCIGTNNTWHQPYTSGAITHSFATIRGLNTLSAAEKFLTQRNTMPSVGSL
jgi:hypothetical protein